MAVISREFIDEFARRNTTLSDAGVKTLEKMLAGVDMSDVDAITQTMNVVCSSYSEMSAALAARFYDEIRAVSYDGNLDYSAAAYSGYSDEATRINALGVLKEVDEGKNTVPWLQLLGNVVSRIVKDSSDNSIRENARRDPAKPKYAIVARGDACAFCVMRASLGYHYPEKSAVKSHFKCTCVPTPSFSKSTVQGYDPAYYERQYDEAAKALRDGDIPDELKKRIDEERERKGKKYRNYNAILAVMRYQQGIS